MPDRRNNRSKDYQHKILEQCTSPHTMADLSLAQGLTCRIEPDKLSEEYLDLKEQLNERMWEIIEEGLTKRQKETLKLVVLEGKTQNEVAKLLDINQTSVHKIVHGNIDYRSDGSKKRYGGAVKKIQKLCSVDPEIQEILKELMEIAGCLDL